MIFWRFGIVSYEKLRQSLRSWTLFIAWINVLAAIGKISGIVSYFAISNNLDELKKTVDTEVYQTLVAASNIWYPIIYIVALVTNVVVAYLAFRNLAKIKENVPSLMPYRIALGYTVVYNVAIIILAVALGDSLSITLFLFPIIFLVLYGYVYNKAIQLLYRDDAVEVN
ncbi:hypothetical protein [Streptococcus alactolyticus]|uniref:hypothetical protein n=1 Tax=Streptococcus alactolyticus TaxID=29389 RepID=UPI003CFE866C